MTQQQPAYDITRFNLATSLLSVLNMNDESSAEYLLAHYMLAHLQELQELSIYSIAQECHVSRSTIQRFIKSIGYDSFTDLKSGIPELLEHQQAFIQYADHTDYSAYLTSALTNMVKDIADTCTLRDLTSLARRIHEARNVVMVTSEDSSSAIRVFQQAMLPLHKLVRIFTSTCTNLHALTELGEHDVVIICSVSGNYALAVDKQMHALRASKALITANHTTFFQETYQHIYYIGSDAAVSSHRTIVQYRDVYTRYGMQVFLDILYNKYLELFGKGN